MKTAAQIANHPKAQLHREIVERLRAFGSIAGAERGWARFQNNARLWKRIVTYGLALPERRAKLNQIAFPDCNLAEVDAGLNAGNNLNRVYELALGRASLVRSSDGRYKLGSKGLKVIQHAPIKKS